MTTYQIIGLIIYFSCYSCFYIKLFLQSKRGIKTIQIGQGSKPRRTVAIEIILVVMILLKSLVEFISILYVARFPVIIQNDFVRYCGVLISIVGVSLLITAMATLHDSWRGGIDYDQNTELVTTGIYRYSRNPGFAGFDLFYIGISLLFSNLLNIIFSGMLMLILHLQILEEEKFLKIAFGKEYLDYRKKTKRYFGMK